MVNNAAYATLTGVVDHTAEEDWDGVIAVNLNACFFFCKYAAQSMISADKRRQDNQRHQHRLGFRVAGFFRRTRSPRADCNSSRDALAIELAPHNIQVNSLRPDGSRPT